MWTLLILVVALSHPPTSQSTIQGFSSNETCETAAKEVERMTNNKMRRKITTLCVKVN